jgi:hypothetical protein
MDAEKVQVESGNRNERMDCSLFEALIEFRNEASHGFPCQGSRDGMEADTFPSVGILFDDVAVMVLVLPGIPDYSRLAGLPCASDDQRYLV